MKRIECPNCDDGYVIGGDSNPTHPDAPEPCPECHGDGELFECVNCGTTYPLTCGTDCDERACCLCGSECDMCREVFPDTELFKMANGPGFACAECKRTDRANNMRRLPERQLGEEAMGYYERLKVDYDIHTPRFKDLVARQITTAHRDEPHLFWEGVLGCIVAEERDKQEVSQ